MKNKAYLPVVMMISVFFLSSLAGIAHSAAPAWVFMVGQIQWYGDKGVIGWCGAFAKIDEWAEVYASWMKFQILAIPGNYTFNCTRLVDASVVKLDFEGKDFFILGLWDVYKVTLVYDDHGNVTRIMELLVDDSRGELSVIGGWKDFAIAIDDPLVQLIAGKVSFHRISSVGPIPKGDVKGSMVDSPPDGQINIYDLVHTAQAYGDTPGIRKYDSSMDFNFDFTIDIYDLTTIAASLGESY